MIASWRGPTLRLAPLIVNTVATLALAAYLAAQSPPPGPQTPAAGPQTLAPGPQNPPAAPQNPSAGQGTGSAPKPDVRANPQPVSPLTPGSAARPSSAPSGTPTGAPTARPVKPRLRVEWRNGSLYVVAQREPLSTVLSEIARRAGVKNGHFAEPIARAPQYRLRFS